MSRSGRLVAGLVLAAGEGRRFGRPKATVEVAGERLVDHAVRLLREGGCDPIVVVTGAVSVQVPGAKMIDNPGWRGGMGSSLRTGLEALVEPVQPVEAVVVALVDQPWLGPESVRRLRVAHTEGALVAAATYAGRRGNPVLLDRSVWTEVVRLAKGDVGARAFMATHPDLVVEVPCDDTGRPDDIDEPADLPSP